MSENPSSLQAFFAEMMRRRVFRVMAVYGAVVFVVIQLADIVFPAMGLPEWTMGLVLGISMIGFPIAVVLAWAFESTPDGMKRTAPAAPEEIRQIVAAPVKSRWPAGLLALAGVALVFGGGWWMGNRGTDPATILVSEAQASEFKALAVLPFQNVNETEENRLIAVGVHEDLLSQMSRIAALRVTSPTSVREYANTEKSPQEIADELGVEFIMEGSVRSAGDQVRVTVTLVDPATNETIWNEQYDREVTSTNLFDIQSEIARTVVGALEAELTPQDMETLDAMKPAASLAAQSWYHRGRETYRGGVQNLVDSRDALLRAVAIDSQYVPAWNFLAHVESRMVFIGETSEMEPARLAMERTVEIAPGSVEAHLATGFYEYYAQRDFPAAQTAFEAAERLAPSDSEVIWALGLIHRRQGNWDESTEMMKRAVQLDPRNPLRLETLAENLSFMGAYEDANAVVERQLSIDPVNARARGTKVGLVMSMDLGTDRAHRLAAELGLVASEPEEAVALTDLAFADRDFERIVELNSQIDTRGVAFLEDQQLTREAIALHLAGNSEAAVLADSLLVRWDTLTVRDAGLPVGRAFAHAIAGRREEALEQAAEAERWFARWDDHVNNDGYAFSLSATYGRLGELDAGFALMDQMAERVGDALGMTRLTLAPALDPYRDDPRFDDIIRRREAFEAENQRKAAAGRPWLP